MVSDKNFTNQPTPSVIDTEYRNCNFTQHEPVQDGDDWKGVRLFPGDDTPRTFDHCNLMNCELPPGSTVLNGQFPCVKRFSAVMSTDTVEIDGEQVEVDRHSDLLLGHYNPTTGDYEYLTEPHETEID